MPDIDPTILVFLGTVFGGVGLRYVDHWLTRKKATIDEGAAWRAELRQENVNQKSEIDELEKRVEYWRDLYYDLRDAYALLKVQLEIALSKIKTEASKAEKILPSPKELPPPHHDPEADEPDD